MCVIITDAYEDPCPQWVGSMDNPFCEECEDRHPTHRLMPTTYVVTRADLKGALT